MVQKVHTNLYFPEEMLKEIQEVGRRQDRSISWLVIQAWKVAREEIKGFPSAPVYPQDGSLNWEETEGKKYE